MINYITQLDRRVEHGADEPLLGFAPSDTFIRSCKMFTLDHIQSVLSYCPDTGVFRWKRGFKGRSKGSIAGTVHTTGTGGRYIRISIRGKKVYAHRLAVWMSSGAWPCKQIDHINNDGLDNRLSNLRVVDSRTNAMNRKARTPSALQKSGIVYHGARYAFHLKWRGATFYKGGFQSAELAAEARALAVGCLIAME